MTPKVKGILAQQRESDEDNYGPEGDNQVLGNDPQLLLGRQLREHLVNRELLAQMLSCGPAVAGQNNAPQTFGPDFIQHAPRLRPDIIAENEPAEELARGDPSVIAW
jgi:hypothetical protein